MLTDNTAFMLSGQGAQSAGMGMEFCDDEAVKQLYDMAEIYRPGIIELMRSGSAEDLSKTINTQPCMYLADLASSIVRGKYFAPKALLGFSVGEVPALAYSGVFSYEDGFKIVLERARLMQEACEASGGAMFAVIGSTESVLAEVAGAVNGVYMANCNALAQTVMAVENFAVESFKAELAARKLRMIRLNVSGAFHCPTMAAAAKSFERFLRGFKFNEPQIPVYSNTTALPYAGDMVGLLANQMAKPVKFHESITNMVQSGINDFEEQGVGNVLTKLVQKMGY